MSKESRETALTIIRLASSLDRSFKKMPEPAKAEMLDAWELVFENKVWPQEGKEAVINHYARRDAFPVKAGDVVDFCARQPPWSSPDHARAFVRKWSGRPFARALEKFSGLEPSSRAVFADDLVFADAYREWAEVNEDLLVEAILVRKHRSVTI